MNRKFRELIPLFAIALMIIGAVALLIVMNTDSSKKKPAKKTETKVEEKVEDNTKKEEVSKPVGEAKKEENKEENKESKTETKVETKEQDSKKQPKSVTDSNYISTMVTNILGNDKKTTVAPTEEAKEETFVNAEVKEPITTTIPGAEKPVEQPKPQEVVKPTQNVSQPAQQTISQSRTQTAKATAYIIKKSVNYGGYTVAITSNDSIIAYNTSSKVISSTDAIPSRVTLMQVYYDKIYVYVPKKYDGSNNDYGYLRVYSLNNGTLRAEAQISIDTCKDFVVTTNYAFVLREDDRIYAHKITNGVMEQAQSGFTNESGGIAEIKSASGNRVTAKTNNGETFTYTCNGVNLSR